MSNQFRLTNNGTLTHTPQGKSIFNYAVLSIDSTSRVSANERGYASGESSLVFRGRGPEGEVSVKTE